MKTLIMTVMLGLLILTACGRESVGPPACVYSSATFYNGSAYLLEITREDCSKTLYVDGRAEDAYEQICLRSEEPLHFGEERRNNLGTYRTFCVWATNPQVYKDGIKMMLTEAPRSVRTDLNNLTFIGQPSRCNGAYNQTLTKEQVDQAMNGNCTDIEQWRIRE